MLLPRLRLLQTDQQFEREHHREDLRDRRWRRHQSMIITLAFATALVSGQIPVNEVIDFVQGQLGLP